LEEGTKEKPLANWDRLMSRKVFVAWLEAEGNVSVLLEVEDTEAED